MGGILGYFSFILFFSSLYFKIVYSMYYFCNEFLKRKIRKGIRKI